MLRATDTGLEFDDGWFNWTLPDDDNGDNGDNGDNDNDNDDVVGNTLYGGYSDFSIDPSTGDHTLGWVYVGGTGDLEGVSGFGRTLGNADLNTLCAVYAFSGILYEDDWLE